MKARILPETASNNEPAVVFTVEDFRKAVEGMEAAVPPKPPEMIFFRGAEVRVKQASEYAGGIVFTNGVVFYKNGEKLYQKEISDVKE